MAGWRCRTTPLRGRCAPRSSAGATTSSAAPTPAGSAPPASTPSSRPASSTASTRRLTSLMSSAESPIIPSSASTNCSPGAGKRSPPQDRRRARIPRSSADAYVVGEIGGVAAAAADQQPMIPGRRLQPGQPQPGPVIEPLPLAAGPGREPLPGRRGQSLRQLGRGVLAEALVQHRPQLLVAADGEHEGLLAALQIHPEMAIGAVDLIAQHPGTG